MYQLENVYSIIGGLEGQLVKKMEAVVTPQMLDDVLSQLDSFVEAYSVSGTGEDVKTNNLAGSLYFAAYRVSRYLHHDMPTAGKYVTKAICYYWDAMQKAPGLPVPYIGLLEILQQLDTANGFPEQTKALRAHIAVNIGKYRRAVSCMIKRIGVDNAFNHELLMKRIEREMDETISCA